jgi:hypothetical protein
MSQTKDEIAAERDALREQSEQLRGQLAAAGAGDRQPYKPQPFMLTEGARQELEATGLTTINGRQYTREQALAAAEDAGQTGIEIGEPKATAARPAPRPARAAVAGVDFVYPSVAPGQIDPAVAGTPGINGPAADVPAAVPAADVAAES